MEITVCAFSRPVPIKPQTFPHDVHNMFRANLYGPALSSQNHPSVYPTFSFRFEFPIDRGNPEFSSLIIRMRSSKIYCIMSPWRNFTEYLTGPLDLSQTSRNFHSAKKNVLFTEWSINFYFEYPLLKQKLKLSYISSLNLPFLFMLFIQMKSNICLSAQPNLKQSLTIPF